MAVAGPDRDESDKDRVVLPKLILAERLPCSAERANGGIANDGVCSDGAAVRLRAVAVASP